MTSLLALYAVRVLLMLSAGAFADRILRGKAAALRHLSWSLVLAGSLLLGPLSLVLPAYRIALPARAPAAGPGTQSGTLHAPLPDGEAGIVRARRSPDFLTGERARAAFWLAGSLVLLARLGAGRLRLAELRRRAAPLAAPAILEEAAAAVGCRRRVRLLENREVAAPVTFGVFRPVILLPIGFASWPESRLRAVLLHELAHVARRDALAQLLADLVCALHWFDPLAWHAARRLALEREHACDDRVLGSGLGASEYARQIVEVARQAARRRNPAAALAIVRRNEIESRILEILNPAVPRARTSWPQRLRSAAGVAILSVGLGGLTVAAVPAAPRLSLDDPLSEIVPVRGLQARPSADELRASPDAAAIGRLMTAAAHVKTWEGDLVRERAEWALSQARQGEVVRPLIQALEDPDWRVQGYAAWSLGAAGDRRAVAPISRLLDHPVWRVRAQAIYALLDLGAELDVERLTRLAKDPAWQVRIGVVEHLQRRGGAEAAALLRTMADDPHAGTRMAVRAALAEIGA
ncbi:MAG TPA: M56 family metallopeptidase [Thermoanaerobaculia bacterium]